MIQGTQILSSSSSQSEQTKSYFNQVVNKQSQFSFEQRLVLKLISENDQVFSLVKEIPLSISQVMNKQYLINNHPMIGQGSYGAVFICNHLIKDEFCAVKVHQRCEIEEIIQQVNEYRIQNKLNNKFPKSSLLLIDKVYVIQESQSYFTTYAAMEMGYATLSEYAAKINIEYEEFLSIYHEILKQILEMHSLRIAHRDIKPQNIIYTNNGWMLSDFGCALSYQNQKGNYSIAGTRPYIPLHLRVQITGNFTQIICEQNLFDNDIYSFLLSMLQLFKKNSSMLQLQQMLDNECLLKELPSEFQIYGKSYNYIKLNILVGLHRIPISSQYMEIAQNKIISIFSNKLQDLDYLIELHIKQQQIASFQQNFTLHNYNFGVVFQSGVQIYDINQPKLMQTLLKYNKLLLRYLQIEEDKSLLEIDSTTKSWQYNLIQNYYRNFGNVEKQYQSCLRMQQNLKEPQINYRIFEIECLIEQDQLEKASQIVKDITDQQYLLDDMSYVELQLLITALEKSWLETADELSKHIHKTYFQSTALYIRLRNNLAWINIQYNYTLDNLSPLFSHDETLGNVSQMYFNIFGIKAQNPQDIVLELEERGSDKFGIRYILLLLINCASFSIYDEANIGIDELYECSIKFYEKNNLLNIWEIYFHYSINCAKQKQYQKALSLINKAASLVDNNNNLYLLQILFQLMHCQIHLNQQHQSQNTLIEILKIVIQIQSEKTRLNLVKRIVRILYLSFIKQQSTHHYFNILEKYLKSESSTEIIFILNKLEWETVLSYRQPHSLVHLFNNKILSICEKNHANDIDTLKSIQNIAITSRAQIGISKEIQNIAISYTAKLIQNIIIFEDIYNFQQTETLNSESEIIKYMKLIYNLGQLQYFNEEEKMLLQFNEGQNLLNEYSFYNYQK